MLPKCIKGNVFVFTFMKIKLSIFTQKWRKQILQLHVILKLMEVAKLTKKEKMV